MVQKEKVEALVLVIEEARFPWYYDVMKFLELGVYPYGADKREGFSIRMMAMPSYVEVSSIEDPMMVYTFII